jgi:tetratricopeptide (TPR) repeat protein
MEVKQEPGHSLWRVSPQNPNFVGRQNYLLLIDKYFTSGKSHSLVICSKHGGEGKTTLANQVAHLMGPKFTNVYWIDATSPETLCSGYRRLGEEKALFQSSDKSLLLYLRAKRVKDWLEKNDEEDWLLVLDNAQGPESIEEFIPIKGGKVLITSRNTQWPHSIYLDMFTLEEAKTYVLKVTRLLDSEEVNTLIDKLNYFPLAIAQACAYIRRNNISAAEYLTLLNQNYVTLSSEKFLDKDIGTNAVALTWEITLKRLREELPSAIELLNICAYLNENSIPTALLRHYLNLSDKIATTLDEALTINSEYSVLSHNNVANTVAIHKILQDILQRKLQNDLQEQNTINILIETMLHHLKNAIISKAYASQVNILSHLVQLSDHVKFDQTNNESKKFALNIVLLVMLYEISSHYNGNVAHRNIFEKLFKVKFKDPIASLFKFLLGIIYLYFNESNQKQQDFEGYFEDVSFDKIANDIVNSDGNAFLESLLQLSDDILGPTYLWSDWFGSALFVIYVLQNNPDKAAHYRIYYERLKKNSLGSDNNVIKELNKIDAIYQCMNDSEFKFEAFQQLVSTILKKDVADKIVGKLSLGLPMASLILGQTNLQITLKALKFKLLSTAKPEFIKVIIDLLYKYFGDILICLNTGKQLDIKPEIIDVITSIWVLNDVHRGQLHIKLGQATKEKNNLVQAAIDLESALPLLSNSLGNNHSLVIKTFADLAFCYMNDNLEKAVSYIEKARSALKNPIVIGKDVGMTLDNLSSYVQKVAELLKEKKSLPQSTSITVGYGQYNVFKETAQHFVPPEKETVKSTSDFTNN